jgi:hypothetical protein
LIVVDGLTLTQTAHGHPVLNWFEENYRPFSMTDKFSVPIAHPPYVIVAQDQFVLLSRKGATLDRQK